MELLDELDARGLIHESTDRDALQRRLSDGPVTLYHGMDPSADSLHTGNLIGLVMLRRFQLAGHRPIALAGGATGMVGDPGGRSEERNLLDEDSLRRNVGAIKAQIARVLGDEGEWTLVDNYEWTRDIPLLAFLRDVGKHVTVNQMMARESVRARIESEHGISYTEFSYMLLQANDYWWLHEHEGCELQVGGSDQWGNILSGVDLIRRRSGAAVHALCWPLLTASDGRKLGKTTGARTWLDGQRTTPHELFQHFVQTDDRQVRQLLLWFTLLPIDEIDDLVHRHAEAPQRREAQRRLAHEVVAMVHGEPTAQAAERGMTAWTDGLQAAQLEALEGTLPTTTLTDGELPATVLDLLVRSKLAPSKSAATRLLRQGGAYVNDAKVDDESRTVDADDFVSGRWLLLRAGKRQQHLVVRARSG
ncbi:MAG TPA: tyrosine--tRNA ligase [Acidimicrobiales bacterium]|jgi:tyrosyl-tRNA synthetase|nr:tyrosine--tRNA ligase [Acidimicrobiales bacterium]